MTEDATTHSLPNRAQLAGELKNPTAKRLVAALEDATSADDVNSTLAAAAAHRVAVVEKELARGDDAEVA
jgi:hypothetical protein